MMLSALAPRTTRVLNVWSPPRTARAARPVASLVVDAGVMSWVPCSDTSTCPVAGSATSADTLDPSAAADSGPDRAARSPLAVGTGLFPVPVARTVPPARDRARREGGNLERGQPGREHPRDGDGRHESEDVDHSQRQHDGKPGAAHDETTF